MRVSTIRVFGTPAPQGSKRHVGGGRLIESSRKVGPWRAAVAEAVARSGATEEWTGPIEVNAVFLLPKPRTVSRPWPTVPPDLDKLVRGLYDALTIAGVWQDDSLVVIEHSMKMYALIDEPGALVTIRAVDMAAFGNPVENAA